MSETPYDSRPDTKAHICRVKDLIFNFSDRMDERAAVHDASKLEEPEKSGFDRVTQSLAGLDYGSDEYRRVLREDLGEVVAHHYANNTHHPEHTEKGIEGMSLLDIVEMLLDWKAASERHETGDILKSIDINAERFGMSPQLVDIFKNTAREFGWG